MSNCIECGNYTGANGPMICSRCKLKFIYENPKVIGIFILIVFFLIVDSTIQKYNSKESETKIELEESGISSSFTNTDKAPLEIHEKNKIDLSNIKQGTYVRLSAGTELKKDNQTDYVAKKTDIFILFSIDKSNNQAIIFMKDKDENIYFTRCSIDSIVSIEGSINLDKSKNVEKSPQENIPPLPQFLISVTNFPVSITLLKKISIFYDAGGFSIPENTELRVLSKETETYTILYNDKTYKVFHKSIENMPIKK